MWLFENGNVTPFLVEAEAYEGVKKIADKVADDVAAVCGRRPRITAGMAGEHDVKGERTPERESRLVLMATLGQSPLLDALAERKLIDVSKVQGKREVYGFCLLEEIDAKIDVVTEAGTAAQENGQKLSVLAGVKELLVIYGSDKRGTIYGMFHLSEHIGVSPLYFWGDAKPQKKDRLWLDASVGMVSKEPSVKYRGFFINDEWPCFGNWTFHHYGGFTAEMYDKVFELLLRLKGNYLWPAMWTSSFALDGPGEKNALLADLYGVIMGNSHHEPALRAGEEWDIYRGEDSIYGNEWNYVTNKEGLLRYWEDGLKRSGRYESIITVGMRGERDSIMEGPKSLEENIAVLKDIIVNQKELIKKNVSCGGGTPPLLLAIYKEVERYFYGSREVSGLREWDGIDDVIWMFCEDNFGHMRYLPEAGWKEHKGGYGMYYHLDYHGAPVSYEWINSTPLPAIWEQMTLAYEYGVRDVWMVNAGDLKGNEYPLSYFMELAYDYDQWGSTNLNSAAEFTEKWMRTQFGDGITEEQCRRLVQLLTEGTAVIGRHRPEALCSKTYHPCHEREADRVMAETKRLMEEAESLREQLPKECLSGYDSMLYYPLRMGLNLIQMQLFAGKNEHYARQGKVAANEYADRTAACMKEDKRLVKQAAEQNGGKWYGMYGGAHIGFVKWNEDGRRCPLRMYVEPVDRQELIVSRSDGEEILVKNYGNPESFSIYDFMDEGAEQLEIELANGGRDSLHCEIVMEDCGWLAWELTDNGIVAQEVLRLVCKRSLLPKEEEVCTVRIVSKDTEVRLLVHGRKTDMAAAPKGTFFPRNGRIVMLAEHYVKADCCAEGAAQKIIPLHGYGLCGSGIKCAPFTYRLDAEQYRKLMAKDNAAVPLPAVSYPVWIAGEGDYHVEVWSAPVNPVSPDRTLQFAVRNQTVCRNWTVADVLSPGYEAGEPSCQAWCDGVLSQIHKTTCTLRFAQGVNELWLGFLDGVLPVEKLIIYPVGDELPQSAMGPVESLQK